MLRLAVSNYEQDLLNDIQEVGYGELYQVVKDDALPVKMVDISERSLHFIRELRRLEEFEKVTIHDSEPTIAEFTALTENHRSCLKRIKF
jgi:hypothetical protein